MLTPLDALRSLHWYVAQHLLEYDENFDIRIEGEETDFERPSALVTTAGPNNMTGSHRITTNIRPHTVYIYPPRGATTKDAKFEAENLVHVCEQMFRIGGHQGHPARVPNFDWDEVPAGTPLPDDASPVAYLRVSSLGVDEHKDPDDPKLRTVVCDVRVTWTSEARPLATGPLLQSVGAKPADDGLS